MNGLPKICATKADYEYIRQANIEGWKDRWLELLDGRWIVDGDDLVEDPNAPLFRLGYTVAEVEAAIGFSGLTSREIEWRQGQADRWQMVDGQWREINGWKAARLAAKISEAVAAKMVEIEAESQRRQSENITWSGHSYFADPWATKTVESCCSVASALAMKDTDPIRVPPPLQPGYWMTADTDVSGNRLFVYLTVGDMRKLLAALYDRNGAVWGKEVVHKATIEAIAASGATPEQIEAYDVSVGWD